MKFTLVSALLGSVWITVCAHVQISDDNSAIDAGLKQWKLMIPGPTVTIPGSAVGLENDVVVSDIGSMKRTGQTTSRYHLNDLTFFGFFGFTDLKLSNFTMLSDGAAVTLGGTELNKAVITSSDNSIQIEYSAKIQKEGCTISWAKFNIVKMDDVKVNGGGDVTEEFAEKVLPALNQHLNDKAFLELLNQYMTPCKESPLRKLFWGA